MGEHVLANEHIVAAQKDLCHHIGFVSIIFDVGFHSQVIEAVCFWGQLSTYLLEGCFGVFVDCSVALLNKFQGNVSGRLDDVLFFGSKHEAKQGHQGGFATTDRTGQ